MPKPNTEQNVIRSSHLRWVPIPKMKVSPAYQREISRAQVDKLAANFDLEKLSFPVVNEREGWFYIIDGQTRIEALKVIGYGDQNVQCETYVGLTESEEAEKFLGLNDRRKVSAWASYTSSLTARREVECDIERIVRAIGLQVSQDGADGSVGCVTTLAKVYKRSGPATLSRTLRLIDDTFGTPGLEAPLIDGIGLLCQRYNGELSDEVAVTKLKKLHGGVDGLLGRAAVVKKTFHRPLPQCIAAAVVDVVNSGRGGKKLPDWWK